MRFTKVEVNNFRNLISTSIIPSPNINLISGHNGSGKTTLLEALYYLATGTSFRTHKLSTIINSEHRCFTLFAQSGETSQHRLGLQRCRDLLHTTRLDGREIHKRSDLVHLMPIQVITPDSISILTGGSEQRRNYIDWSLFHVEQSFHFHLGQYQRALKQRNALLKSHCATDELHLWSIQMVEHGMVIDKLRSHYIALLQPIISGLLTTLLPETEITLQYRCGWNSDKTLEQAFSYALETDRKMKYSTVGPHRADIAVYSPQGKAIESLSRGQLKLTVVAFRLAQSLLLYKSSNKRPVILIDDIAAELDKSHRALVFKTVRETESQLFITTPDLSLIDNEGWDEKKVFHVEHGQVKEVV